MSANVTDATSDTAPRSSHLSPPSSSSLSPVWGRPRSPLSPHRLAKLANALGVATPVPAIHPPASGMSTSYSGLNSSSSTSYPDQYRRSPTPSTAATSANFTTYSQSTSKFLLHVVPPLHLPHESDSFDVLDLPPPSASGYHPQFRRGTLVAMHSTLQSQLSAIAKEYALPSTSGMILYLVTSTHTHNPEARTEPVESLQDEYLEEPGPRLSEDIWKHLWARVAKVEREETLSINPHSTTHIFGLGIGIRAQSPQLSQESPSLRPFISTVAVEAPQPLTTYPFTSSPTTTSTPSDLRSLTKSAPPSSSSISHSDPETPNTSVDHASRANSLDLPGLHSSSFVPILAKVEFDIDRRKAGWYEPWIRSRKMNLAKRAESRASRKESIADSADGETDGNEDRKAPLDLMLVGRIQTASPVSFTFKVADEDGDTLDLNTAGYQPLAEDEEVGDEEVEVAVEDELVEGDEDNDDDDDNEEYGGSNESADSEEEEFEENSTARVSMVPESEDPLEDVFGADADTWADMHDYKRPPNPYVVDLALTGAALAPLSDQLASDDEDLPRDEDEVKEILKRMSQPPLPASTTTSPMKRSSSPTTFGGHRKQVPPPLILQKAGSKEIGSNPLVSESSSPENTRLPYLHSSGNQSTDMEEGDMDEDFNRLRSPLDSEKRVGGVFDDLDLGFEFEDDGDEFDENDPDDRRRSQYLMKAQLDEIERNLLQFSPRRLKTDLAEEQGQVPHSATLSPYPSSPIHSPLSFRGLRNGDVLPPSPGPLQTELPPNDIASSGTSQPAWPAIPFAALKEPGSPPPSAPRSDIPSPPRLAINGVTTSAPKAYLPHTRAVPSNSPSESDSRKRQLADEQTLYPVLPTVGQSPIIPLSPDPFGRFSSTILDSDTRSRQSVAYWDSVPVPISSITTPPLDIQSQRRPSIADSRPQSRNSTTPSSRFSADSLKGEEPAPVAKNTNRATLISVKSIKKLWRKSNSKHSISGVISPTTPSDRHSPVPPPPVPSQRTSADRVSNERRPSQELLSAPPSGRTMPPQSPVVPNHDRSLSKGGSNLDFLYFNQESPYPVRRSTPRMSPQPPPPAALPSVPESSDGPEKGKEKEGDKVGVRKSILKSWKSASGSISQSSSSSAESRASTDLHTTGGSNAAPRRPNVLSFGPGRAFTSPPSQSAEIPPSPAIPEAFMAAVGGAQAHRKSASRSSKASPSIDSTHTRQGGSASSRRSVASSRTSSSDPPSFDTSQFEMVSPKMGSKLLSYPYHGLDHD